MSENWYRENENDASGKPSGRVLRKISEYTKKAGTKISENGPLRIIITLSFGVILAKNIAMMSGILTVYSSDTVQLVFGSGIVIGIALMVFFDTFLAGIESVIAIVSGNAKK